MAAQANNGDQPRNTGATRPSKAGRSPAPTSIRFPTLDADVVAALRPRAEKLSQRISARVHTEVAGLADTSMFPALIKAIDLAVGFFTDALAGAPARGRAVTRFFRELGEIEAKAGHNLDAMRAAHQIATQEAWHEFQRAGADFDLHWEVTYQLGHALLNFQGHLLNHAAHGFNAAGAHLRPQQPPPRTRLIEALLQGGCLDAVTQLAREIDWPLPESVSVVTTTLTTQSKEIANAIPEALAGSRGQCLTFIAETSEAERLAQELAQRTEGPVTLSWGVPLADTHHAARWSARLHRLALAGHAVIEPGVVLLCEDHRANLCLHADPILRKCTDLEVLAPLLGETPKRRAALAETMLLWLQTRESAPALATRLHVHQQTVRHRLQRVRELFGDRLEDPSQTVALLTALESATPSWRAEAA